MKLLFDSISLKFSKITTYAYSTSFTLGIYFLNKRFRNSIYSIYGFVRIADEIVDSFEGYDKQKLLKQYREEAYKSIEHKISLNPILNSFQKTVNEFNIDSELIDTFLKSMEMDLEKTEHNQKSYDQYILGSAEVVGLMCLKVFTENNNDLYENLKPFAMKLGAAFQKVNFLRDLKDDYQVLGRTYFPNVEMNVFDMNTKKTIEKDIEDDFRVALIGIKKLPASSKGGVYLAYVYYQSLFKKIRKLPAKVVLEKRVRINNGKKVGLMFNSLIQNRFNWI